MNSQKGQSLVELLVAAAIVGCLAMVTAEAVDSARRNAALTAAISDFRANVLYIRTMAVARDRNVAIRFREETKGVWNWTVYEDGDGDGVRNDDIQKGVDRPLSMPRRIAFAPARIGLPDDLVPDPMNGKMLQARPPVRFGASMLCSFSRQGEVTNGSMVLTDGTGAAIIRIYGKTGRIAVLRWNGKKWKTGA